MTPPKERHEAALMTSRDEARAKALEADHEGTIRIMELTSPFHQAMSVFLDAAPDMLGDLSMCSTALRMAIDAYLAAVPSDAPAGGDAPPSKQPDITAIDCAWEHVGRLPLGSRTNPWVESFARAYVAHLTPTPDHTDAPSLLNDREMMRRKIEADPDLETEAGVLHPELQPPTPDHTEPAGGDALLARAEHTVRVARLRNLLRGTSMGGICECAHTGSDALDENGKHLYGHHESCPAYIVEDVLRGLDQPTPDHTELARGPATPRSQRPRGQGMTNLLALNELETHLEAIREDGNAEGGNVTVAAMIEAIAEIRKRHIPDLPDDIL